MDVASYSKLKRIQYNMANMSKKPYLGHLAPIAFRDTSININSNANQTGTTRMRIFPQFTSQDIVLGYANYYNGGLGTPTANANSITVKASIEINGNLIPVYFNSSRTVTITAGSIVYCDPIPCIISASDTVYIRTFFDAGVGGYIPINTRLCLMNGVNDGVTYGSDLTDSGTPTNTSQADSYSASIILGVTPTKRDAYLLFGDSIMDGTGDEIQVANGAKGFAARALTSKGLPWNKISMGGETVANALKNLYMRKPFFNDHTKVIVNYATNDISPSAQLSVIQQNLLKLWQYLSTLGLTVYQTTISPKTTSTDSWISIANQTVQGSGQETLRQNINAWLRDTSASGAIKQSNGTLYKVLDTAVTVEDAATGKWKVYNSGAPIFTGTATSATSNTLTCSSLTFASRALDQGCVVVITGGTGSGQSAQVDNNYSPATQLVMKSNWTTIPDATSTFSLYKVATYDGTHPTPFAHVDMSANVNV